MKTAGNGSYGASGPFEVRGKRILIVGMGASGAAAAAFLSDRGAQVTVTDRSLVPDAADQAERLRARGVVLELGEHRPESFAGADLIVVSPGVPETLPPIRQAAAAGVPVIGELELASRFITTPIIAITGTNGKTTTTTLLDHLLTHAGYRVVVGGNIGTPLVECAEAAADADVMVVEVSSFQLDTIDTFRPHVSIILNITPDHLDRYRDMTAYADSKARILMNQTADDVAILNGKDPEIRRISAHTAARKWFLHAGEGEEGGIFSKDEVRLRIGGQEGATLDLSCLRIPGSHNRENAVAAALAAIAFGAAPAAVQAALGTFDGLPHRITEVATVGGVRFYDDSKGTNIDAVIKALNAFEAKVVLIMGGRNKGYRFGLLADAVKAHAKGLVVIGEAASEILADIGHLVPNRRCADMEEAVREAFFMAKPGEVVLLSPGCASFDMFKNYAHRGEMFCKAVAALHMSTPG